MPAFSINVKQRVVLVSPVFSQSQMRGIGQAAIRTEKARLASGVNVNDAPAKPLSRNYARRKRRIRGSAIRDLNLTGSTIAALGIVESSPLSVVIGFTTPEAARRAALDENVDQMVGLSPHDQVVVNTITREVFAGNVKRANQGKK